MLPRVKINFENGKLGLQTPQPDGLLGIICSGAAVPSTFALGEAYKLRQFADLDDLGVTEINNPSVYKIISEFYREAEEGTEVWLMAVTDTVLISEMVDVQENYARALINATGGNIRGLIVSHNGGIGYTPVITDGLDEEVYTAVSNAQALGEWAAGSKFAPLFTIIEATHFAGNPSALADITSNTTDNRVAVMIGDTTSGSKGSAVGILAGRIASVPVQRNIGRVKDGPLSPSRSFIGSTPVELADITTIHDKGFITFRNFIGRAGYFFNDDTMATKPTDDYSHLTARRTIDKAFRLAYDTLLEFLLDEIPVNSDGTIQLPIAKSWEAEVENRIAANMSANGELSVDINDPADKGVKCFVDPTQNIVSTSKVEVNIAVRPFGYPRYIDVNLGFEAVVSDN